MRLALALVILTATAAHAETVEELTATARNIARDGRCEALPALAARVQMLDGEYYARVFAVDPVIASCTPVDARLQMGGPPSLTPVIQAPPPPPPPSGSEKSATTAVLLSLGMTVGGFAVAEVGANNQIPTLSTVGSIMFMVGPTTGHIYAGHTWNGGLAARLIGVGAGFIGLLLIVPCIEGCSDGNGTAGAVFLVGGALTYAGGGIYEIATAGEAAHRYNREHGFEAAVVPTANGVALAGRF